MFWQSWRTKMDPQPNLVHMSRLMMPHAPRWHKRLISHIILESFFGKNRAGFHAGLKMVWKSRERALDTNFGVLLWSWGLAKGEAWGLSYKDQGLLRINFLQAPKEGAPELSYFGHMWGSRGRGNYGHWKLSTIMSKMESYHYTQLHHFPLEYGG